MASVLRLAVTASLVAGLATAAAATPNRVDASGAGTFVSAPGGGGTTVFTATGTSRGSGIGSTAFSGSITEAASAAYTSPSGVACSPASGTVSFTRHSHTLVVDVGGVICNNAGDRTFEGSYMYDPAASTGRYAGKVGAGSASIRFDGGGNVQIKLDGTRTN